MTDSREMELIFEIFSGLLQQGPGSNKSTLKALGLLPQLEPEPRILDLGCGSGRQTIALAKATGGSVTAVDIHQPFLDELTERANDACVGERITCVRASMDELPEDLGQFDLVWSEGAVYIVGFQTGLEYWRSVLEPDGLAAVSELSWLVDEPSADVKKFWAQEYPDLASIDENLSRCRASGYRVITSFALPDSDWWPEFYDPLSERLTTLAAKYCGDKEAEAAIESTEQEMDIFRRYSKEYGYVFYLLQRS